MRGKDYIQNRQKNSTRVELLDYFKFLVPWG